MSQTVDPAIRLAPGHAFTVEPPPNDLTYGFIGHGVDMVPQVWPHAQCVFTSQSDVVRPPTHFGSPGPNTSVLGLPRFVTIEQLQARVTPRFWFFDNVESSEYLVGTGAAHR